MRCVAVVSVGRSDRGQLAPVIEALGEEAIVVHYDNLLRDKRDTPTAVGRNIGDAVRQFAQAWEQRRPDLILLFGDRYEMLAAAMASLPFAIPLAHLHGGETTIGAFDNQIRHALTKMAHLHFVSHRRHGARVHRMGEERWRIHVTGAPGLDRIVKHAPRPWWKSVAGRRTLVTLHPCTLEYEDTERTIRALIEALRSLGCAVAWTTANADTYGSRINSALAGVFGPAVEPDDAEYLDIMAGADVMVGNSSSGLIEAPSFRLPAVNIGRRQYGRLRGDNVIDVGITCEAMAGGLRRALDPAVREKLSGVNPYGDGQAAPRIAHILRTVPLDRRLLEKQ